MIKIRSDLQDDHCNHGHAGTLADFTDLHYFHFHPLGLPARMVLHGVTWCHMTRQTSPPGPVYPVTSLAHGFEFRAFRAEGLVHLGLGA